MVVIYDKIIKKLFNYQIIWGYGMKYEIMIKILFDLLNNKKLTAAYIASKYSISQRTVYRYIDAISLANIPVACDKGRLGGFYILDNFKLTSSFMTKDEFSAIISTLDALNAQVKNSHLLSGTEKLRSITKIQKDSLTISSGNLLIDASHWGDSKGYKSKLDVLSEAIEKCRLIEISYHNKEGKLSERIIEPHVILLKQGLWYVYAYCREREDFRIFKTGRIERIKLLDETFARKSYDDPLKKFEGWYESVERIEVTFLVEKSVLSDVEEWLGIENVQQNEKGEYIAIAHLPNDNGLISKILTYGNGIKVLSPVSIKKKLINDAKALVEKYEK